MPNNVQHPEYIYRIVHINNVNYLLGEGMCSPQHRKAAMNYTQIGDPALIRVRSRKEVPIAPGGMMSEYVPFYFGGKMPMLWSMLHVHEILFKRYQEKESGWPQRFDARGTFLRHQSELVIIACKFQKVLELCPEWCFTDGHATSPRTHFYNDLADLARLNWYLIDNPHRSRDWEADRVRQAEFLVRDEVPVACIDHLVIRYEEQQAGLEKLIKVKGLSILVQVDYYPHLFFEKEGKTIQQLVPYTLDVSATDEENDYGMLETLHLQGLILGETSEPELEPDEWDAIQDDETAMELFEEKLSKAMEESDWPR